MNYRVLNHASILVEGSKVVYVDPYGLSGSLPGADVVLVTHDHYDHASPPDIRKVLKPDTIIVCPVSTASKVSGLGRKVITVKPGDKIEVNGISVEAVPAYNIGKQFHPKSNNWVGYVFTVDGKRFYHAGDTDRIPEMKDVECDVAFVPIGGTYTMNAEEAAEAVKNDIKPGVAVPMHYGSVVGSRADAERFAKLSSPVKVEILL